MDFTKIFCDLVSTMNVGFVLNDKPISSNEVFAATGLLPAIARRADQLCLLCLGYGIGVTFVEAEGSLLGTRVQFDEVTPNGLRLLFFYDVINEIVENSHTRDRVALDELMYGPVKK
jgi:intracellular multiplication protein IcmS